MNSEPSPASVAVSVPYLDGAELVIPPNGRVYPSGDQPRIGVRHPGCDLLAELAIELDWVDCRPCGWKSRISGAWCADRIDEAFGIERLVCICDGVDSCLGDPSGDIGEDGELACKACAALDVEAPCLAEPEGAW